MILEEAIKTAIECEKNACDVYKEALKTIRDSDAKRIIEALAKDERYHVVFLENKLVELLDTGKVTDETLDSVIPSKDVIERETQRLQATMNKKDLGDSKRVLSKALKLEIETSNLYKKIIEETGREGKEFFSRFIEIEDAHIDFVQAELDFISKSAHWFDEREFTLD